MISVFMDFRPAVLMLGYNILLLVLRLSQNCRSIKLGVMQLFSLWCMLSVLIGVCCGVRLATTISSYIYVATPMFLSFSSENFFVSKDRFFKATLIAIVLNNLFGTICFYLKPAFFVEFIHRTSQSSYAQLMHHAGFGRLVTIFGSIETAILSGFGVLISLGVLINRKSRFCVFSLLVCFATLILTQQRGPLFALILIFIIIGIYLRKQKLIKTRFLFLIIVVAAVTLGVLYVYKPTVFYWEIERILNPSDAVNERFDYQWDVLVNNLSVIQWVTGKGIGAFGFFVDISNRLTRIFDQMYFNIEGELGLVGLIILATIFIKCIKSFSHDERYYFTSFFIVFMFFFGGLGTTLTYYPQITAIVWFSVGFLLNNKDVSVNDCIYANV